MDVFVGSKDRWGRTPLDEAEALGYSELAVTIRSLINSKGQVKIRNGNANGSGIQGFTNSSVAADYYPEDKLANRNNNASMNFMETKSKLPVSQVDI